MRPFEIGEVLAELTVVTEEVIAAAEAADIEMNKLSEASERLLEQRIARGAPPWQPEPRSAIANLRSSLMVRIARKYRDAAREFAAWWADVATIAVFATVTGQSVHPARVAAADPTIWFGEEGLQHLPDIPDDVRQLTELAARMATTGPDQADVRMADVAAGYAARAGLLIGRAEDGQIVATQDGTAEARRCRLWGEAWTATRVPALPTSDELAELLTSHGAPPPSTAAVVAATRAVDDAVVALLRAQELECSGDVGDSLEAQEVDIESLWSQADRLTELLCQYARTLTDALPDLAIADQPR